MAVSWSCTRAKGAKGAPRLEGLCCPRSCEAMRLWITETGVLPDDFPKKIPCDGGKTKQGGPSVQLKKANTYPKRSNIKETKGKKESQNPKK